MRANRGRRLPVFDEATLAFAFLAGIVLLKALMDAWGLW